VVEAGHLFRAALDVPRTAQGPLTPRAMLAVEGTTAPTVKHLRDRFAGCGPACATPGGGGGNVGHLDTDHKIAWDVVDIDISQSDRLSPVDHADHDTLMRMAAFEHVRRLTEVHDRLTAAELRPGFVFDGERIPLMNPQRGIFKPHQMRFLLSIKTVFPKPGGKVWYDDQREVHRQIFEGDEAIDYAFMGQNVEAADNRWLHEAYKNQVPIIYFLGIAPGRYQAVLPAFIAGLDTMALKARVVFGVSDQDVLAPPETALERRYALRAVKQRLHQASFREAVITAYDGRCALSGLPEPLLLDAAHIVADKDEKLGQPVVTNGIPLSKIHHAAFDAHLIGIDPDYQMHVSDRLLYRNDGPMLEALKRLNGEVIHLPRRFRDHPDRDRLAVRFEFKAAL
jgi:putative restriction endonuclease